MASFSKSRSRSKSPPKKRSPCVPPKIRDSVTKRCREKKSPGRKLGSLSIITQKARDLAKKTEDAYSFSLFKDWIGVCKFFLKLMNKQKAEFMVRSKYLRYCTDEYSFNGKVPLQFVKKYFYEMIPDDIAQEIEMDLKQV